MLPLHGCNLLLEYPMLLLVQNQLFSAHCPWKSEDSGALSLDAKPFYHGNALFPAIIDSKSSKLKNVIL